MKKILLLMMIAALVFSCKTKQPLTSTRALETVNVGTAANDGTGDPLRTAFQKVNAAIEVMNDVSLDQATGATGTGNLVFSDSPTLTGTVTLPSATSIGDVSSTEIGYVNGVTSNIQTQLTARQYEDYDYYIEESGGTVYARPSPNTSLPAYSDALLSEVLTDCMGELTTGGKVFIAEGTFAGCDSIVVPYDNITIQGAGKYKTSLKLKDHFDSGKKTSYGFIQVHDIDYFTIKDIGLDGNSANQDSITYGLGDFTQSFGWGVGAKGSRYTTIDNCYLHDFTTFGVHSNGDDWLTVKNCHIKNNLWNGITFGWGTDNNKAIDNLIEGSGDVGIAVYGRNNIIDGNIIRDITGSNGWDNSRVAISIEVAGDGVIYPYVRSQYHQITNNMIKGAGQEAGIVSNAIGEGALGIMISGNYIDSCEVAISMMGDSCLISNNKIVNPQGGSYNYGIFIQDGDYNLVTGNDITSRKIGTGDYPILLANSSDGADYNKIIGNNLYGGTYYSIGIAHANCDGNYIAGNIFDDSSGGTYDIYDVGTGTIKTYDNYDIHSARFNPVVTGSNRPVTYTGDGVSVDLGEAYLKLTPVASPPGSPTEGTIYMDTDHHLYLYNGSAWVQLDN